MEPAARYAGLHSVSPLSVIAGYRNTEVVIIDDSQVPFPESQLGKGVLDQYPTARYFHFNARMSIGRKRNLAVEQARGSIIVTWDDDDFMRTHRIAKQIQPILAGEADVVTLAHGVYLFVHGMRFYNWTLNKPTDRSPHFGTLAYSRTVLDAGVRCTLSARCASLCSVCVLTRVCAWEQTPTQALERTTASPNERWMRDSATHASTTQTDRLCMCVTTTRGF